MVLHAISSFVLGLASRFAVVTIVCTRMVVARSRIRLGVESELHVEPQTSGSLVPGVRSRTDNIAPTPYTAAVCHTVGAWRLSRARWGPAFDVSSVWVPRRWHPTAAASSPASNPATSPIERLAKQGSYRRMRTASQCRRFCSSLSHRTANKM